MRPGWTNRRLRGPPALGVSSALVAARVGVRMTDDPPGDERLPARDLSWQLCLDNDAVVDAEVVDVPRAVTVHVVDHDLGLAQVEADDRIGQARLADVRVALGH